MKYMLLIYVDPKAAPEGGSPEQRAEHEGYGAFTQELVGSGALVSGDPLHGVDMATTVRVRDGVPALTDGPFAEAKEQLAGYLMLECDRDRAVEIATRWPDAKYFGMEVRPVMDFSGTEM